MILIFNLTKSKQIEGIKTKYDTEKKEQQIALQNKEITVLEQKAEISTLQKILLGRSTACTFTHWFLWYSVKN